MDVAGLVTLFSDFNLGMLHTIWDIVGPFFTAFLVRKDMADRELEKAKAETFKEVALQLLNDKEMTYVEYYKAKNFLTIAEKADIYYSKMEHNLKPRFYDVDWFVRFYEESGNISNEKIQDIWAKILAGEINQPSTYSLLTINVLKNLNQRDAELFERVLSHSICNEMPFVPNYENYFKQCKITFDEIMYLDEIGLLNSKPFIGHQVFYNEQGEHFIHNMAYCIKLKQIIPAAPPFFIEGYPCTSVGKELALLQKRLLSDEDIQNLAQEIQLQASSGVVVSLHKVTRAEGNKIAYNDENLINTIHRDPE